MHLIYSLFLIVVASYVFTMIIVYVRVMILSKNNNSLFHL